ncbi:MAG TPA: GDSL-type esterase/lipase family protein [Vicinamibacterales bacterium]|nr:GDSL-type esterase/lipase family protein [Vicinamibacterales bacterium]
MTRPAAVAFIVVLAVVGACTKATTPTAPTDPPVVVTPLPPPPAPTLSCPSGISTATTAASATVSYTTPEAEGGQTPTTVSCTPGSGTPFSVGTTQVSCTATDALNRTASCLFTVVVSRTPTISRTRFVAFGDSITVGWTSSDNPAPPPPYILTTLTTEAYPSVLQTLLNARYTSQSISVGNEGKGGERAQDALGRASAVFNGQRPEVVLIMTGYNDLAAGESGIEPGVRAVNDLVKEARFRGARVLLGTLTPSPVGIFRGLGNTLITRFNERLRDVARGENVPLVDVYAAWAHDPNRYNSADGRHPNTAGYRLIAETFFAAIRAEFENR